MTTIGEVLHFHAGACRLFERLIDICERDFAEKAMGLWMWLESGKGFDRLINAICYATDDDLWAFLEEAEAILGVVRINADQPNPKPTPLTSAYGPPGHDVDGLMYYYNKNARVQVGVARAMNEVGRLIFDDTLRQLMVTNRHNVALTRIYEPGDYQPGPVAFRALIISMTVNECVSERDIESYFIGWWGEECIEQVVVEQTTSTRPDAPLRAKVLFKTAAYLHVAFGEEDYCTHLLICGKWFRVFRPLNREYDEF